MSRTAIFLSNETSGDMAISSVDGHIECEQLMTQPGEVAMVASIGDPGGTETATTGNIWIHCAGATVRVEVRKGKKDNAEILESVDYGYSVTGTNDYPESGSVYSKSLTIHIS